MAKKHLAILNNIVTPNRAAIYRELAQHFRVEVLLSGREDNRKWEQSEIDGVPTRTVPGFTFKYSTRGLTGKTGEERYLHINHGYITELFRTRPDFILTSEMGIRSAIAVIYGLLTRTPVWLLWLGGLHTNSIRGKSRLRRFARRYFFAPLVRHWIAFGDVSAEYLHWLSVPSSRIVQTQNPVDEALFSPVGPRTALTSPRPRGLFVGRLIENKGIYQLLRAAKALQNEGYEFSLVLLGDGPEKIGVTRYVESQGIENVERIEWVDPSQMASVYRGCDFMIFPTLDDVWGLVVNEALLSGLPIAASRYAGCAAELLPAHSVFDPLDTDSLLHALKRGVVGELQASDASILTPVADVAQTIADAMLKLDHSR